MSQPQELINIEEILWSIPHKIKGFWNTIFAYGCTSNPKTMYKNLGYGRTIICPHCNNKIEVPKYTRTGKIMKCNICNNIYKFKPSY